jgi:hypothetical protein
MKDLSACFVLITALAPVIGRAGAAEGCRQIGIAAHRQRAGARDGFWAPRIQVYREKTIPHSWTYMEWELRSLRKAAGEPVEGELNGTWGEANLYKFLETVAYSLAIRRDPELEKRVDESSIAPCLSAAEWLPACLRDEQPETALGPRVPGRFPRWLRPWAHDRSGHRIPCRHGQARLSSTSRARPPTKRATISSARMRSPVSADTRSSRWRSWNSIASPATPLSRSLARVRRVAWARVGPAGGSDAPRLLSRWSAVAGAADAGWARGSRGVFRHGSRGSGDRDRRQRLPVGRASFLGQHHPCGG